MISTPIETDGTTALSSLQSKEEERQQLNPILYEASEEAKQETLMYKFQQHVGVTGDYEDLWKWSVQNGDEFWTRLVDFVGLEYTGSVQPVRKGTIMPDVEYFPNVQLNFAQNMLKHGRDASPLKDTEALVSVSESRDDKRW